MKSSPINYQIIITNLKRISLTFLFLFFTTSIFGQQQSPNILLIIADDLGIDAISGFGVDTDLPSTPTLDAFRENGYRSIG
jgi:hypothetical protein